MNTGREVRSLLANSSGGTLSPERVVFSPDGKLLAAGFEDSTVVFWNVATGQQVRYLEASGSSIAFSPSGKEIVAGSGVGAIKLWNVATGKELRSFEGHSDWLGSIFSGPEIFSLAFSPDEKKFISASRDATIKLWDSSSGNLLRTFSGHTSEVRSVAFSPNGEMILSGSYDGTMKLWRPDQEQAIATLVTLNKSDWIVVTPDDHFECSIGAEKLLRFVGLTSEGKFDIIPTGDLKASRYETGLLERLLKG